MTRFITTLHWKPKGWKEDGKVKEWAWEVQCTCGYKEETSTLDLGCEMRQKHTWEHRNVEGRVEYNVAILLVALFGLAFLAFLWVSAKLLALARF